MGRIVFALYRPHAGQEQRVRALAASHVPSLREWGLATGRTSLLLQAGDGTMLEIFEWESAAAIERAHNDPRVQALWGSFAECCDFRRLAELAEAEQMFPDFTPLD
jgi:hypothetical protein